MLLFTGNTTVNARLGFAMSIAVSVTGQLLHPDPFGCVVLNPT